MMKRKHLHTLLIMCIALLCAVTVKAGDNKWTLNANQTEWLYTYTTDRYPTTFLVNGYSYNGYAQGKITFSFRNTRVTDRIANAGWADFGMRIGTAGDTDPGSTIPTYQSSGTVQVSLYYANGNYAGDVSYQANAFPHFHYYNSHLEDDGTVKLNDEPVLPYGFWWILTCSAASRYFSKDPMAKYSRHCVFAIRWTSKPNAIVPQRVTYATTVPTYGTGLTLITVNKTKA